MNYFTVKSVLVLVCRQDLTFFIHCFTIKFNPFSCSQCFYNFFRVHMVFIRMFYHLIYTENSGTVALIVYCVFRIQQKSLLNKVNQLKINKWN